MPKIASSSFVVLAMTVDVGGFGVVLLCRPRNDGGCRRVWSRPSFVVLAMTVDAGGFGVVLLRRASRIKLFVRINFYLPGQGVRVSGRGLSFGRKKWYLYRVMMKQPDILKLLNPQYFWDVDLSRLNSDKAKRLIIDRVFGMGSAKEIKLVIEYFGSGTVLDVLKNVNYLDPKTLNFVSKLFNVSLQSFKCYRRKQLTPQHWNS